MTNEQMKDFYELAWRLYKGYEELDESIPDELEETAYNNWKLMRSIMKGQELYEGWKQYKEGRKAQEKAAAEKKAAEEGLRANLPKNMVRIYPLSETEKSYQIEDGSNGKITRGNCQVYYKHVAKKLCIVIGNEVYAPFWIIK